MTGSVVSVDGLGRSGQMMVSKGSSAVAGLIITVVHLLTFAPLLVLLVLQDVYPRLAIVLNTAICICLVVGNLCFYRMSVVQVYPKTLDTFLLALYASLIPVAYVHIDWLREWLLVLHHGAVACFMWMSILIPCCGNFAMEGFSDWLPKQFTSIDSIQAAALHAAQGWAGALTIMALAALGPVLSHRPNISDPIHIVCNYVLGFTPLLLAAFLHWWCKRRSLEVAKEYGYTGYSPAATSVHVTAVTRDLSPAGDEPESSTCPGSTSSSCNNSSSSNAADVELGIRDAGAKDLTRVDKR